MDQQILSLCMPGVNVSVVSASQRAESCLYPEEKQILTASATRKRTGEFTMGRTAARNALAQFGITRFPVLKGRRREPIWPSGYVGSITHKTNMAVAAVAGERQYSSIGIDLEHTSEDIPFEMFKKICVPAEIEWAKQFEALKPVRLMMLFSAKESIYKALNLKYVSRIGFQDVQLNWVDKIQAFTVDFLNGLEKRLDRLHHPLTVTCLASGRSIFTCLAIENHDA